MFFTLVTELQLKKKPRGKKQTVKLDKKIFFCRVSSLLHEEEDPRHHQQVAHRVRPLVVELVSEPGVQLCRPGSEV